MEGDRLDSWGDFVAAVEREFGMNAEQKEERFLALEPRAGESSAQFVLRVERMRRAWGQPAKTTLQVLTTKLDAGIKRELKQLKRSKKLLKAGAFEWADVVEHCRDVLNDPESQQAASQPV